tara:strand:- start:915 stop:1196 length:282 start_codon:yes stop_codon:yes gene_type:complete
MENKNPDLEKTVEPDTGLKTLVVNYIGDTIGGPEDITVDMAVQVFAAEFPEFLMAVAEENFVRGYEQALTDVEHYAKEQADEKPDAPVETTEE